MGFARNQIIEKMITFDQNIAQFFSSCTYLKPFNEIQEFLPAKDSLPYILKYIFNFQVSLYQYMFFL